MRSKIDLGYGFNAFGLVMCCAVALAGTGCFGLLPPQAAAPTAADEPQIGRPLDQPEESFFNQAEGLPSEPPVEEPIRPIGEPIPESPDLTDDGVIDDDDIEAFIDLFGSSEEGGEFNPAADFDGDGEVTLVDFQIFLELIAESSEQ